MEGGLGGGVCSLGSVPSACTGLGEDAERAQRHRDALPGPGRPHSYAAGL